MKKVKTFDCTVYMPKWHQQLSKLELRRVKCKFLGNDDSGSSDVVQEIKSGKVHFANRIFKKKNEIINTSFNNKDSLVSAKKDFELDVLEDTRKNSEKSYRRNQKLPHDITLRTNAQRN